MQKLHADQGRALDLRFGNRSWRIPQHAAECKPTPRGYERGLHHPRIYQQIWDKGCSFNLQVNTAELLEAKFTHFFEMAKGVLSW